ncbi:MAG: PIN domain-containing protein [Gammaproteobacteria bacterium]
MAGFVSLFDACVLYPAPLRDLLLSIAQTGLFRARWTARIHEEWIRAVLRSRPDLEAALTRTREAMNAAVADCLITGYEPLIDGLTLPDSDDRHVLAAAIQGHAAVIVTYNLKDFPAETLKSFGIVAEHPDQFISNQFELSPPQVALAVKNQRTRLKNPPKSVDDLLDTFLAAGLAETVAQLKTMKDLL